VPEAAENILKDAAPCSSWFSAGHFHATQIHPAAPSLILFSFFLQTIIIVSYR